jgi:hypothetical protein
VTGWLTRSKSTLNTLFKEKTGYHVSLTHDADTLSKMPTPSQLLLGCWAITNQRQRCGLVA